MLMHKSFIHDHKHKPLERSRVVFVLILARRRPKHVGDVLNLAGLCSTSRTWLVFICRQRNMFMAELLHYRGVVFEVFTEVRVAILVVWIVVLYYAASWP